MGKTDAAEALKPKLAIAQRPPTRTLKCYGTLNRSEWRRQSRAQDHIRSIHPRILNAPHRPNPRAIFGSSRQIPGEDQAGVSMWEEWVAFESLRSYFAG